MPHKRREKALFFLITEFLSMVILTMEVKFEHLKLPLGR